MIIRSTMDVTSIDLQHPIQIQPIHAPVSGSVTIPGSKSYSNRLLLAAALANGTSTISNLLHSDDTVAMTQALQGLGIPIKTTDSLTVVQGAGANWPHHQASISVGSAGTAARFLPAALAFSTSGTWRIDASEQMKQRPIKDLMDVLTSLGAFITYENKQGCFPLTLQAALIDHANIVMSGSLSSQFISAMIMAAPLCQSDVTISISDHIVQSDYVRITLDVLKSFGITVSVNESFDRFTIPSQPYRPCKISVEPDASTATYFMALAACTKGTITLSNLPTNTAQPDIGFIDILEKMGCKIHKTSSSVTVTGPEQLIGGFEVDMKPLSDASLTLAALAPFADAPIKFYGVKHIRHHECDRLSTMANLLTQLGIKNDEFDDGLRIYPGIPQHAVVDPNDDHRVAMAMTILGVRGQGIIIKDPICVSKTCPSFFDLIQPLGVTVTSTLL